MRGPSIAVTTVFSPDAVSRHRQKDGKDLVDSLLRGLPGGFSPHQRVRGGGPPGVRHDLLRGQQPVRLVLHPELQGRLEQFRAGQQEELPPAHLQEVRLAAGRQQGAFGVKKEKKMFKSGPVCTPDFWILSFLTPNFKGVITYFRKLLKVLTWWLWRTRQPLPCCRRTAPSTVSQTYCLKVGFLFFVVIVTTLHTIRWI